MFKIMKKEFGQDIFQNMSISQVTSGLNFGWSTASLRFFDTVADLW